jgi:hypothetical protein
MKYCITFRQYDGKSKPLLLANVAASTDKLKFYLDMFEACSEVYELLSVIPLKED